MENSKKMVCAYLMDSRFQGLDPKTAKYLTHVNYAFAKIKDGRVTDEGWFNAPMLNETIKAYPEICFILSIGGWSAGGFSEAASTAEGRELFAESAVAVMKKHGFRGLDIDWEYPCRSVADITSSPDDKQNFTLMLAALREKLTALTKETGEDYSLSVALAAAGSFIQDVEAEKLNEILDYVNLMTYDMASVEQVTHHSNLYPSTLYQGGYSVSQAVDVFQKAGFSSSKLVIGGAFYGHCYEYAPIDLSQCPFGRQEELKKGEPINYNEIKTGFSADKGFHYGYDESAQAAYCFNETQAIVYDDQRALTEKVKYVLKAGLGGIMFWEYNGDRSCVLLEAIGLAMEKYNKA